jgi:hypothetical protein
MMTPDDSAHQASSEALIAAAAAAGAQAEKAAKKVEAGAKRRAVATQLWVQSRLGAVGQLGSPEFELAEKPIRCRVREERRSGGRPNPVDCRGDRKNLVCGPLPTDAWSDL